MIRINVLDTVDDSLIGTIQILRRGCTTIDGDTDVERLMDLLHTCGIELSETRMDNAHKLDGIVAILEALNYEVEVVDLDCELTVEV